MKEREKAILYEQILDDTNQLIQISDCESFSMMYANRPARMFTNHEDSPYKGEKCYQYMMGLESQCPFCPMRQMDDKETSVIEIDNGVQVFSVKTKRLRWEGREAFIEYATDITAIKRAQQIFESQMQTLIKSIPEAQGIFHMNLTQDKWISSNGISLNIEKLQNIQNVDNLFENLKNFIPDHEMQKRFYLKFNRKALMQAYQNGKTEVIMETKSYYDDGSIRWARLTARMIMNPNTGDLECIFYGMDIQDEKLYQEKMLIIEKEKEIILEKSKRDLLTGVYRKKAFEQMAQEYIQTHQKKKIAIIFMDLDYFKEINDKLGHLMGDQVIIEVAERLQTIFSNKDLISRFGGDEFCILVKEIPKKTLIEKLEFMLREFQTSYQDDENIVYTSASMGVVLCELSGKEDFISLINLADKALYEAKEKGKNQYCIKDLKRKNKKG